MARRNGKQPDQPKTDLTTEDTLPEAIRKISAATQRLTKLGLNRDAVVVLLRDATGLPKKTIMQVLDGLAELERSYCR